MLGERLNHVEAVEIAIRKTADYVFHLFCLVAFPDSGPASTSPGSALLGLSRFRTANRYPLRLEVLYDA
jgi:hypothetical protein